MSEGYAQRGRLCAVLPHGLGIPGYWQLLRSHQQNVLDLLGSPSGGLSAVAQCVRSGALGYIEAQAARRYWPLVFGPNYRRDRSSSGLNPLPQLRLHCPPHSRSSRDGCSRTPSILLHPPRTTYLATTLLRVADTGGPVVLSGPLLYGSYVYSKSQAVVIR